LRESNYLDIDYAAETLSHLDQPLHRLKPPDPVDVRECANDGAASHKALADRLSGTLGDLFYAAVPFELPGEAYCFLECRS
jgi:hypothetical protein